MNRRDGLFYHVVDVSIEPAAKKAIAKLEEQYCQDGADENQRGPYPNGKCQHKTSVSALVKGLDIILPADTTGERVRLNLASAIKKAQTE